MWEKWSFVFESNAAKYYWAVPEKELQTPLAFHALQKSVYVPCTAISLEGQISFLKLPTDVDIEAEDIGGELSSQQRGALVESLTHDAINQVHKSIALVSVSHDNLQNKRSYSRPQSVQGRCWWANNRRFSWSPLSWVMLHLWASLMRWSAYLEIKNYQTFMSNV